MSGADPLAEVDGRVRAAIRAVESRPDLASLRPVLNIAWYWAGHRPPETVLKLIEIALLFARVFDPIRMNTLAQHAMAMENLSNDAIARWLDALRVLAFSSTRELDASWMALAVSLARGKSFTALATLSRCLPGFEREAGPAPTAALYGHFRELARNLTEPELLSFIHNFSDYVDRSLLEEVLPLCDRFGRSLISKRQLLIGARFAHMRRLGASGETSPDPRALQETAMWIASHLEDKPDEFAIEWLETVALKCRVQGWTPAIAFARAGPHAYFARGGKDESLSAVIRFDEVRGVAARYARALTERPDLRIEERNSFAGHAPFATDGETIFVPSSLMLHQTREENYREMIGSVTHEAGHIEFGSFRVEPERFGRLLRRYRARYRDVRIRHARLLREFRHRWYEEARKRGIKRVKIRRRPIVKTMRAVRCLASCFPNPALFMDTWNIFEDCRIDRLIARTYPGLAEIILGRDRDLWARRPKLEMLDPVSALVEAVLQAAYWGEMKGRLPDAHLPVLRQGLLLAGRLMRDPSHDMTTALEVAAHIFDCLHHLFSRYLENIELNLVPVSLSADFDEVLAGQMDEDPERAKPKGDEGRFRMPDRLLSRNLVELDPPAPDAKRQCKLTNADAVQRRQLRRRFEAWRPRGRYRRRRLRCGPEIDTEEMLREIATLAAGRAIEGRIYAEVRHERREVAIAILLDQSGSTAIKTPSGTVLELELRSLRMLSECVDALGDRLLVYSYDASLIKEKSGRTRLRRIVGPDESWSSETIRRLEALAPGEGNGDGPAMRAVTAKLASVPALRRMLVLITDGGVDAPDDVAAATHEAERRGIRVLPFIVLSKESRGNSEFREIMAKTFGARLTYVDGPENLGAALCSGYRKAAV